LAKKMEYAASHPIEVTAIAERGQQVYMTHSWQREKEKLVSMVVGLIQDGKAELRLSQEPS
jgi:hypothetical protein